MSDQAPFGVEYRINNWPRENGKKTRLKSEFLDAMLELADKANGRHRLVAIAAPNEVKYYEIRRVVHR